MDTTSSAVAKEPDHASQLHPVLSTERAEHCQGSLEHRLKLVWWGPVQCSALTEVEHDFHVIDCTHGFGSVLGSFLWHQTRK